MQKLESPLLASIQQHEPEIIRKILELLNIWDLKVLSSVDKIHYNLVTQSNRLLKQKVFKIQGQNEISEFCTADMRMTPWITPEFFLASNISILLTRNGVKDVCTFPPGLDDQCHEFANLKYRHVLRQLKNTYSTACIC